MAEATRRRVVRTIMRHVWRADPARATASVVVAIVTQVLDIAGAVGLKVLVDAAVSRDGHGVVVAAALLAATLFGSIAGNWASITIGMALKERGTLYFDTRMSELATGIHHVEHHERPDYLDELHLLNQNHQQLASAQDALVFNFAVVVRLGLAVALLARIHPVLLLLAVAGLPSVWCNMRAEKVRRGAYERVAATQRLHAKLFTLATSRDAGKEIRVFGLGDELLRRLDETRAQIDEVLDGAVRRSTFLQAVGWLTFGAGFVAALLLVSSLAVRGQASAGDVVLALAVAGSVNYGVSGLAKSVGWFLHTLDTGRRLVWLEDLAAEAARRSTPIEPAPLPAALRNGIRFEDVSFRYPGTEAVVLAGVDLSLPAGSTVAIVGDNGAGKSTLVKLLCRFYEPDAGRITVDGTDLRNFEVNEWRSRLSGCFQDFARLELVAQEVVGVGQLDGIDDGRAVAAALDRAHAADVPAGLPSGLATLLGRSFEGGVEPSTGQWQKLALGRAMMREEPLLLLLDEPTASLDPVTEAALFERYAGAASRTARRTGAITVLVSHRFSTVRMADLIVVVSGGRITEAGTHEDLVAAAGTYAELYGLQARAYR